MSDTDLGWGALVLLALLSVLCGFGMASVFGRLTDSDALDRVKRRIVAHLLEIRLFGEDPVQVLRAQRQVVWQCLALLRLLVLPAAVLSAAGWAAFPWLDEVFGRAPLAAGASTVATFRPAASGPQGIPRLTAEGAVTVETPPVRSATNEWNWRLRAGAGTDARIQLIDGGGVRWVGTVRLRAAPFSRLFSSPADLSIYYEEARILGASWPVWFLLFSTMGFLAVRVGRSAIVFSQRP